MDNIYNKINNDNTLEDYIKYYWGYQYRLGLEVIIPYLRKHKAYSDGFSVMEVGCAEGGVLAGFIKNSASYVVGTDIENNRLEFGLRVAEIAGYNIELCYHDIINNEIPDKWKEKFDLVILRDVIEHLDDSLIALKNISKLLKNNGILYVTFPPYHSPFGGHQHTVASKTGNLPYIHLLPWSLFNLFIRNGRQRDIEEVKRLRKIRLTPRKFINNLKKTKLQIFKQEYYLLRPVFKMKFGLPAIKLTPIAFLDIIKNIFSLEASYILRKIDK